LGAVEQQRAVEIAYRYIGARERTVREVERKLARAGLDHAQVQETIKELKRLGALDDERYARLFVADKRLLEEWGGERIRRELVRRGVARELIEAELDQATEGAGELERAIALVQRRWGTGLRDVRERKRAFGLLLRKGYDSELALEALASASARCTD
jgi:regulatory protein